MAARKKRLTIRVRVTEDVYGKYPHNFRDYLEGRATAVLAYIAQSLEKYVPEEYRDTAYFEHDTTFEKYDDHEYQRTYLYYERPETDEEMAVRLQAETVRQKQLRQRELEQLRKLQAKYKD